MPFGSRLCLARLYPNPQECDFELVADDAAAMFACTVAELDELGGSKFFVGDLPHREPGQDVDLQILDAVKAWWEDEMELEQEFLDRQENDQDGRPMLGGSWPC